MKKRINIKIDDRLMQQAMRTGNGSTKRAIVEAGLQLLVQTYGQASIRRLRGKVRGNATWRSLGRVAYPSSEWP